jgi:hypothetical protein
MIGKKIDSGKLSQLVNYYNNHIIGQSGNFKYTYHDTYQAYGYCILPDLNWVLLVNQNVSEISSMTRIILVLLSVGCVIILFVVIFFANVLAKKFLIPSLP